MDSTLFGITNVPDIPHLWNALGSIRLTLWGIFSSPINPQLSNAEWPMDSTLLGIVEPLHPTTNVFVAVSIIALQLSLLSNTGFSSSTTILVKFVQLKKALYWIDSILFGISMLVHL